jgi:hypothetical protein
MSTRSEIIRGPAAIKVGSSSPVYYYTQDDIKLNIELETEALVSSAHGTIDERIIGRKADFTFTPIGDITRFAGLWPYLTHGIGDSIFGATDQEVTIQTLGGKKYVFGSARVTKMPDLILSAKKSFAGPVTFTALDTNGSAWSAGTLLAVTDSAWSYPSNSLETDHLLWLAYRGAWSGKTGLTDFETLDGFVFSFDLKLQPLETDSSGLIDYTFEDLQVVCKCAPIGVTEAQLFGTSPAAGLLPFQGTGIRRGMSIGTNSADLVVTGGTTPHALTATLKAAQLRKAAAQFGKATPRFNEIEFIATRSVSAGAVSALFTLGVA